MGEPKPEPHPEDECERCGRPNGVWFTPDWVRVQGTHGGILCPSCFMADADAVFPGPSGRGPTWALVRIEHPAEGARADLAAFLRSISDLGDDAERVAGCILDARLDLRPTPPVPEEPER